MSNNFVQYASRRLYYFTTYSTYIKLVLNSLFYSFSNETTAIFGCRAQFDIAINERTWWARRRGRERWDERGQCRWWGCGRGHPLYARCNLYDTSGCSSREFYRGRDEDKRGKRRGSDRAARHVSGNITSHISRVSLSYCCISVCTLLRHHLLRRIPEQHPVKNLGFLIYNKKYEKAICRKAPILPPWMRQ